MLKKTIKITLCLLIPIIVMFITMFIGSTIILKTNLSENLVILFSIISSALYCILQTILLIFNTRIKGIYCSVITFIIGMALKIFLTVILNGTISMTGQGITGVISIAGFSFLGALIGSAIKK